MRRTPGFTLVELLLAAMIALLILMVVLEFVRGSGRLSGSLVGSAAAQSEVINVQRLLGDRVREAVFIFPPGTTVTLPDTPKTRGVGGTSTWVLRRVLADGTATGDSTMLALILPPVLPGAACSATEEQGCYRFRAYYALPRSRWLAATRNSDGTLQVDYPGADARNPDAWVLVEYAKAYPPDTASSRPLQFREPTSAQLAAIAACDGNFDCLLTNGTPTLPAASSAATIAGGEARLVADYLLPADGDPAYDLFTPHLSQVYMPGTTLGGEGDTRQAFGPGHLYALSSGGVIAPYVSGVTVRLATRRAPGPRLPGSGTYELTAHAKNLGR